MESILTSQQSIVTVKYRLVATPECFSSLVDPGNVGTVYP